MPECHLSQVAQYGRNNIVTIKKGGSVWPESVAQYAPESVA